MPWQSETINVGPRQLTFDVLRQDSQESCGPACVAMVCTLRNPLGIPTSETIAKVWFSQAENRAGTATARPGTAIPRRVFSWGSSSYLDTVIRVLRTRGVGRPHYAGNVREASSCAPHMPGIMRLQWVNMLGGAPAVGAGHFVVCLGEIGGEYIYLDPDNGAVSVPAPPPAYLAPAHPAGLQMGFFTHLVLI